MRMAANTLYSLAQLGLVRFASVVTIIALSWTQGPGVVGLFSVALTFHILLTGWWVGIDDKVVREIARNRSTSADHRLARLYTWRMVADYLRFKAVVSIGLLLAVTGVIFWGGWYSPAERWFIVLMLVSSVTDTAIFAVIAGYAGNERFSLAFAIIALQTILRLAFTALALVGDRGLPAIAVAWLAASALTAAAALVLFVVQYYDATTEKSLPRNRWSSIVRPKEDWPFVTMGIVVILEYQLDIILLSLFRSAGEVGYYSIATTLFALATLPVQAFRMAIYPAMSRYAVGDDATRAPAAPSNVQNLQSLYAWSISSVTAVAMLCALLGFVFVRPVIMLVFGPAMAPATVPAQILMLAVVVFSLNVPHSRFLLATNQQGRAAKFITVSAIVNILANLWLGALFGAPGTAAARAISTTTFLVLAAVSVGRFMRLPGWRAGVAPLAATAITAGFLWMSSAWLWWLSAALALLLYSAIWWSISGLTGTRMLRVAV